MSDTVSEKQFFDEAKSGDLLLFRGNNAGQFAIRAATSSEYDHVAMILKFDSDPNEVYLVEAVGNRGVTYNKWANIRKHIGTDKFYGKLVFRSIIHGPDYLGDMNMADCLSEVIGNKYEIGGGKLMRSETIKIDKKSKNKYVEEGRTFFCSELIAKIFKVIGTIEDDDISCAQYYPHNFTARGDSFLKLTKGTSIGPELQILIDKEDEDNWENK